MATPGCQKGVNGGAWKRVAVIEAGDAGGSAARGLPCHAAATASSASAPALERRRLLLRVRGEPTGADRFGPCGVLLPPWRISTALTSDGKPGVRAFAGDWSRDTRCGNEFSMKILGKTQAPDNKQPSPAPQEKRCKKCVMQRLFTCDFAAGCVAGSLPTCSGERLPHPRLRNASRSTLHAMQPGSGQANTHGVRSMRHLRTTAVQRVLSHLQSDSSAGPSVPADAGDSVAPSAGVAAAWAR